MDQRNIPSTNEPLPVIGLGTWQTFDVSGANVAGLRPILERLSERGGALVDSSPMYGRAEEVLGEVGEALRRKLFLATKVWTSGVDAGVKQIEASFRKLRAEVIDLFQVHNLLDAKAHLGTLAGLKREGRIRYVGITHYTASAHAEVVRWLESTKVDFVQINYSIAERDAERRLFDVARDRGVAVIANRPFAGGELIRRLSKEPVPSFAGDLRATSWAQLLLKFALAHPAVTCVIPATSKLANLDDFLAAGEGPLPDAALCRKIVEAAHLT